MTLLRKYPFAKRFLKTYLSNTSKYYTAGMFFLVITILLTTILPKYIQQGIDLLNQYDISSNSKLRNIALVVFFSGIILCITRAFSRVFIFIPGRKIENQLRKDLFQATTKLPLKEVDKLGIGDVISRTTNDISSVRVMFSMGVLHITNSLLMITLCLYFMFQINIKLTFLCLIPVPLLIIFTNIIAKKLLFYSREAQKALGHLSESAREMFKAYDLFLIFDVLKFVRQGFDKNNDTYLHLSKLVARSRVFIFGITNGVINLAILLLIYFGSYLTLQSQISIGNLVAFSLYMSILIAPLRAIGWLISSFQRCEVCLARIFPIIDLANTYEKEQEQKPITCEEEFSEKRDEKVPILQGGNIKLTFHKFSLDVDSIKIEKGKKYGIFGRTGSGKSILIKILAGKIPPQKANLQINGINYNHITQKIIQKQFAYVWQNSQHFIGSIEDNLDDVSTSGSPQTYKKYLSEADAYNVSQLENDIHLFSEGKSTLLGEFGLNLSGGQKQRLALARALVYPAQVLCLDDFVSACDHKTEKKIISNIFKLKHTIILTSHRISALEKCDEIWIMQNGKIIQKGSHKELLETNKEYSSIFHYQQFESQQKSKNNE